MDNQEALNGRLEKERWLSIRNDCKVTLSELKVAEFAFRGQPIVFLNACDLGILDPTFYRSFVEYLQEQGARTVVAPDCKINDWSAAKFAQSFYESLFSDNCTVGEALFRARRYLLDEHSDLTGMAYGVYGQSDASLSWLC